VSALGKKRADTRNDWLGPWRVATAKGACVRKEAPQNL